MLIEMDHRLPFTFNYDKLASVVVVPYLWTCKAACLFFGLATSVLIS